MEKLKAYNCILDVSYGRIQNEANNYIDMYPNTGEYKPFHMNLVIDGFASTSVALVIHKGM